MESPRRTRGAIAQFQAALTHGHPTALAAADLTAAAIVDLAAGGDVTELTQRLRDYCESQRTVYHADWLGNLWRRPDVDSPQEFIACGWDDCLAMLDRVDLALAQDAARGQTRAKKPAPDGSQRKHSPPRCFAF